VISHNLQYFPGSDDSPRLRADGHHGCQRASTGLRSPPEQPHHTTWPTPSQAGPPRSRRRLPTAGISSGALARRMAPMRSDGRAAKIGHHATARAGVTALEHSAPARTMPPHHATRHGRTHAHATAHNGRNGRRRASQRLSGASGDDARRPGGCICVRGCGRRRSVLCVSGVGGCGVPRAPHAKVVGARQRAIGRSRACAARKSAGSAHLTWAAVERSERPARAAVSVGAAALT
jgi:hypothetical protein